MATIPKCLTLLPCIFLLTQMSFSQVKGDWAFTIGGGFPKFLVASVKFFVSDNVALNLRVGGMVHLFNAGADLQIHMHSQQPHTFISIGNTTWMGGGSRINYDSTSVDSTVLTSSFVHMIDIGVGREFSGFSDAGYVLLGPSYVWNTTYNYRAGDNLTFSSDTLITHDNRTKLRWLGFLDVGEVRYAKNIRNQ